MPQITTEQHTIEMILDALYLYSGALSLITNPSERIQREIREVEAATRLIESQLDPDNMWGMPIIALDNNLWELLRGVCLRYVEAKKTKLAIAKQAENIIGSTEADEENLDLLSNYLHAPEVEKLGSRQPLVKNFIRLLPSDGEAADKLSIQVQAGNIYGQLIVAGSNIGNQTQKNKYYDIYEALNELTESLTDESTDLPAETRGNAVGDVQTIQAQLTKENPDKDILKKALSGLSVLADTAQLGQVGVALAPHVDKLMHAMASWL